MIDMIGANHNNKKQGEWAVFFLEIWKLTIHWKNHWRIDDSPKCKHPFTWWCWVDLICDLCMSFASQYLKHKLFIMGFVLVGESCWCCSCFMRVIWLFISQYVGIVTMFCLFFSECCHVLCWVYNNWHDWCKPQEYNTFFTSKY